MLKMRLIGLMPSKGRRVEKEENFRTGNNTQNDEDEDEPPQPPTPVRTLDKCINNSKHNVTKGNLMRF